MSRARKGATAAACLLVLGVVSCGGARNTLGTSASVCFKALPGANEAVHRKGHLVGVRRVDASLLQGRSSANSPLAALPPKTQLCVFAFHGSYTGDNVAMAPAGSSGSYAVVALAGNEPVVVASLVLNSLPTRFRHTRA